MADLINQAVVFTKPLHHLGLTMDAAELDRRTRSFFLEKGFNLVHSCRVTGGELADRDVIRQHYQMYSAASCASSPEALGLSDAAKATFQEGFGKSWEAEVAAGRIMGNPILLEQKGISADQLYLLWNECFSGRTTQKLQDGVIMAWLEPLDCYCINAFYPAMEANFYNPATRMDYYVLEFSPQQLSWEQFRKTILGVTDASKAVPESFRGQLYAEYPVEFPGRDNFVHGSAGPLEGLVERVIHEPDMDMESNPVGRYMAGQGLGLTAFKQWMSAQSIARLGHIFDVTEEKNSADILGELDTICA